MGWLLNWLQGFYARETYVPPESSAPPGQQPGRHMPAPAPIHRAAVARRLPRGVVIDCETTGLSWARGDRIVSLAGIELLDGLPTERRFSLVFNPGRPSAPAARRVHGLSDEYLAQQQSFSIFAREIREFIGGDSIVAHNASFDLGFVNNELGLSGQRLISKEPVCTMRLFRERFTGSASLDNCCATYGLDISGRARFHGAFVDAALTAALYQGLTDERSPPISIPLLETIDPTNAVGLIADHRTRSPKKARKKRRDDQAEI